MVLLLGQKTMLSVNCDSVDGVARRLVGARCEQRDRRLLQRQVAVGKLFGPEAVQAAGEQRDDILRPSRRVGVRVDQRQVAGVGVADIERDADQLGLAAVGEERLASFGATDEAVLKGADAVETGAMGTFVDPTLELHRITNLDHGDQPAAHVGITEVETVALAAGDVRSPRPGEAVGLLLLEHRRLLELAGPGLHGVAELVGQHHRHRRLAELIDQLGQQLGVVVDHEVAFDAVEGVALHVDVAGVLRGATPGDALRAVGVGGVDAALQRLELGAVQRRELLLPVLGDVAERGGEVAVVVVGLVLAAEVDDTLLHG